MISFKNQTVERLRATWVDDRGDKVQDWANPNSLTIEGCRVQPMQADEVFFTGSNEGGTPRDAVVTRWKLLGPKDADIAEHDRIVHAGKTYEVEGSVLRQPSPTGALDHTVAYLEWVDG